jgi:hypothetical protein
MLKTPMMGANPKFIKQPLFSGPCMSKMGCVVNDVVDVNDVRPAVRGDVFERSQSPNISVAIIDGEGPDSEWETFPLLAQYKQESGFLTDDDREKYKVVIRDNQFFHTDNTPFNPKSGQYRYVLDANGQLYIEDLTDKESIKSHASFVGDTRVRCAGRMLVRFVDGRPQITGIDNESGHYQPSNNALDRMADWLTHQGIMVGNRAHMGY